MELLDWPGSRGEQNKNHGPKKVLLQPVPLARVTHQVGAQTDLPAGRPGVAHQRPGPEVQMNVALGSWKTPPQPVSLAVTNRQAVTQAVLLPERPVVAHRRPGLRIKPAQRLAWVTLMMAERLPLPRQPLGEQSWDEPEI